MSTKINFKQISYVCLLVVLMAFTIGVMSACDDPKVECAYGTYYAHDEHKGTILTDKYLIYTETSVQFVNETEKTDVTATQMTDGEKEITFKDAGFENIKLVKDSKNCFAYYENGVLVCYYTLQA